MNQFHHSAMDYPTNRDGFLDCRRRPKKSKDTAFSETDERISENAWIFLLSAGFRA
jgi:hypothetical protein